MVFQNVLRNPWRYTCHGVSLSTPRVPMSLLLIAMTARLQRRARLCKITFGDNFLDIVAVKSTLGTVGGAPRRHV